MVRGRKEKFPSERVTIMITEELDSRIKMDLAKEIMRCAKDRCTNTASSYSKIINVIMAQEFEKGTDKKIISAAREQ